MHVSCEDYINYVKSVFIFTILLFLVLFFGGGGGGTLALQEIW